MIAVLDRYSLKIVRALRGECFWFFWGKCLLPNAAPQPLPEAGARYERTLEAVGCRRLFGSGATVCREPPPSVCEARDEATRRMRRRLQTTNDWRMGRAYASRQACMCCSAACRGRMAPTCPWT